MEFFLAYLHPICNKAEGQVAYGMQTRYIFPYFTSVRVIRNLSLSLLKPQSTVLKQLYLLHIAQNGTMHRAHYAGCDMGQAI